MTVLPAHTRGDTFSYARSLTSPYLGSDFSSFKFTLRTALPGAAVLDDSDPTVIAQASVAAGSIVFTGADFVITIAKELTTLWPLRNLYWDLQGVLATGGVSKTLDSGTILINGDVTRTF
jgi:hypothetical protein